MAVLTEEQTMIRDMAREWADNESPVTAFRRMRDAAPAALYDADAWKTQAEMGWAGVLVPEEHGGVGMGYMSLALVLEQLGRTLTATPLVATAAATSAILIGGSDAQKAEWLPRIASGEVVATLAVDEGPRFGGAIAATVEGGKLSGTKEFVAEGDSAQLFVVAAADGLYLVPAREGVTISARHLVDFRSHAQVRFEGAPAARLEGGKDLLTAVTDRATACACAEMLGLAEAAFGQTNDYLKTRVQFGQLLSSFQALQHRMAKMFTELELMRSAVEGAFEAIDSRAANVSRKSASPRRWRGRRSSWSPRDDPAPWRHRHDRRA
jgi:alkylation response protein AidB-like acyl-CoA dehydrogenase